jgi:Spy/CpxP family protein refolding chaperone
MHIQLYRKTIAAALCAGGLGLAMGAHAQPAPEGGMQGPQHGGMHQRWGGHHGGGGADGEMRRGLRALDLTEAQRDQIFKIRHDQAPAFRDQMKKVRASHEELQKLALADKFDQTAVRRAADSQAKAMSELAVMRAQTTNRVRAVLTPEQRTKLDQMREQHRHGPRGPTQRG